MIRLRVVVVFLLAVAAAVPVVGQPDPSPHAWVVIDDPVEIPPRSGRDDEGESPEADSAAEVVRTFNVLLHIPPRVPVAGASPAPDLRVARVARLTVAPEWLVPVGSTVYCIMPADEQGVHRVGRSRAYPRGLRDLWGADPARRLEVLPAITGTVLAVASDGSSPIAATQTDAGIQLVRLEGSEWAPIGGPFQTESAASAPLVGIVWRSESPSIVQLANGNATWATLGAEGWKASAYSIAPDIDTEALTIVGPWNGELIAISGLSRDGAAEGGPKQVFSVSRASMRALGRVPSGAWRAAAIVADPGRLVLVSTEEHASEDARTALPSPGLKQRAVTVAEFSLITGSMLAMGEATASSPVSRGEFQSLAILLVVSMVVVLVVVVRPPPRSTEPVLPPGTAIATSGRRLVSSLADVLPSLIVTGALLDLTPLETLGPIALPITGSIDLAPLLMVLSITSLHCAIGEMLTGRSLGKMLTGIFVARVDPVPGAAPEAGRFRPPTPSGALLRNIMKWFLFPATAIVLSDPSGRHRGDLLAKSAVLMPVVESE